MSENSVPAVRSPELQKEMDELLGIVCRTGPAAILKLPYRMSDELCTMMDPHYIIVRSESTTTLTMRRVVEALKGMGAN